MATAPSFTCICLQKRLILKNKAEVQREQQRKLEKLVQHYGCDASVVLSGGCVLSSKLDIGQAAGFAAVMTGHCEGLSQALASNSQADSSRPRASQAELLCHMYQRFGRMAPQKLRGDFSFVLFDPSQARVLAAVSPTSQTLMIQARDAEGNLVITTKPPSQLPAGCHTLLMIPPGSMKYGWSSDPQPYAPSASSPRTPQSSTPSSSSSRFLNARSEFIGAIQEQGESNPGSGSGFGPRDSLSSVQTSNLSFVESECGEPQSPAPKKTRRGKRAGKNQKLRAESLKRISTDELGRLGRASIDLASLPSATMSASSFGSRADEQNWWRTNTPRQSLELPVYTPSGSQAKDQGLHRFSMSATAPSFVPHQPGLFSRQSVPTVRAQATALSFPERKAKAPVSSSREAFVVASKRGAQDQTLDSSMISPFSAGVSVREGEGRRPPEEGKADAAWNETSDSQSSQQGSEPSSQAEDLSRSSQSVAENSRAAYDLLTKGSSSRGREASRSRLLSGKLSGALEAKGQDEQGSQLSRLATGKSQREPELVGQSPRGSSPRGMSPGGSPTRPPKPPKNSLTHFLKSIMPKRGSQVDLWAEAGRYDSQRNWLKSSSHGDLVSLHHPEAARGSSGPLPTVPLPPAGIEGHGIAAREDTARQLVGRLHASHENLPLGNLKISEPNEATAPHHHHQPSPAQWLAQKTRSMFSKSKSCTDLCEADRRPNVSPLGLEVK